MEWDITPEVQLPGMTRTSLELVERILALEPNIFAGVTGKGVRALDVGTVNGCAAFAMERLGGPTSAVFSLLCGFADHGRAERG
jgi:hypothetical protein